MGMMNHCKHMVAYQVYFNLLIRSGKQKSIVPFIQFLFFFDKKFKDENVSIEFESKNSFSDHSLDQQLVVYVFIGLASRGQQLL